MLFVLKIIMISIVLQYSLEEVVIWRHLKMKCLFELLFFKSIFFEKYISLNFISKKKVKLKFWCFLNLSNLLNKMLLLYKVKNDSKSVKKIKKEPENKHNKCYTFLTSFNSSSFESIKESDNSLFTFVNNLE